MSHPPLRVLWVKAGSLYPQDTGGKIRTCQMLREIRRHNQVTYLGLIDADQTLHASESSADYAQQKIWIRSRASRSLPTRLCKALRNLLFSRLPFVLDQYQSADLKTQLEELDRSGNYDLIVCDFLTPAPHFEPWHATRQTPTVLFQHNVEAMIWQRLADRKRGLKRRYFQSQARRMECTEARLCGLFDGIITVSPEDSAVHLKQYGLTNVLGDVPAGVDPDFFQPKSGLCDRPVIGFLGSMDWMPNQDAVEWFLNEILPRVQASVEGARFLVIGRNPPKDLVTLARDRDDLEVTGTVEDVRPWLAKCRCLIVPLRSGGGTRIKILEAMAAGVPVVSTSVGAEGLPMQHGRDILLADDAEGLAGAILRCLSEPGLAETLRRDSLQRVSTEFSWTAASKRFLQLAVGTLPSENATSPKVETHGDAADR